MADRETTFGITSNALFGKFASSPFAKMKNVQTASRDRDFITSEPNMDKEPIDDTEVKILPSLYISKPKQKSGKKPSGLPNPTRAPNFSLTFTHRGKIPITTRTQP